MNCTSWIIFEATPKAVRGSSISRSRPRPLWEIKQVSKSANSDKGLLYRCDNDESLMTALDGFESDEEKQSRLCRTGQHVAS